MDEIGVVAARVLPERPGVGFGHALHDGAHALLLAEAGGDADDCRDTGVELVLVRAFDVDVGFDDARDEVELVDLAQHGLELVANRMGRARLRQFGSFDDSGLVLDLPTHRIATTVTSERRAQRPRQTHDPYDPHTPHAFHLRTTAPK